MSRSSRPVFAPVCASATARLAATVDLPTPPLPLATAMTLRTSGSSSFAAVSWRHARGDIDRHRVHARQRAHRLFGRLAQGVAQGAGRGGQFEGEGHLPAIDPQILNHARCDQRASQLRVHHGIQCCEYLLFITRGKVISPLCLYLYRE